MRRWIEPEVRRWWRGEAGLPGTVLDTLTSPFEQAFAWGVQRRNQRYDRGDYPVHKPPVPVVSVGNLTVGGTGKTPFTAWLARRLDGAGIRPGIVLRGYGGDELRLHRYWNPTLPSAAATDRIPALERVQAAGARVVILDDGFQHRSVFRNVDLVLVSAEQALGERFRLLPRGPYREPWSALTRADAIVLTHRLVTGVDLDAVELRIRAAAPSAPVYRAQLVVAGFTSLAGETALAPAGPVLAVASVSDPESFAGLLHRAASVTVDLMAFPDHHEYSESDWQTCLHRARGKPIVTTEKDAVKLKSIAGEETDVRVLRLETDVLDGDILMKRVLSSIEA